jgi:hypothetical protein
VSRPPTPLEAAAAIISGAAWVFWHVDSRRLFAWFDTGESVLIVDGHTGELMGKWWCDGTLVGAKATVQERLNAGY